MHKFKKRENQLLNDIKKTLFYGGLDEKTYNKYRAYILEEDTRNISAYMIVLGIAFVVFGIASMTTARINGTNTKIYMATGVAILALLFIQRMLVKFKLNKPYIKEAMIYVFVAEIYAEAIILTLYHPEKQAVTYIAAFLMLPIVFARRPIKTVVYQVICTAVFCILVWNFKPEDVALTDIWNAITFLLIGIAAIIIIVPVRIKNIVQTQVIKELSEHDILTGLRNRNSFEADCQLHRESGQEVVVVYADANGLHELNNTKGHAEGDAMLMSVANEIQDAFGAEFSYRVGGDEFVVVYPGGTHLWASSLMDYAREKIQRDGYSASFGCAKSEPGEGIDSVIKRAEAEMYQAKSKYYMEKGRDRRRR